MKKASHRVSVVLLMLVLLSSYGLMSVVVITASVPKNGYTEIQVSEFKNADRFNRHYIELEYFMEICSIWMRQQYDEIPSERLQQQFEREILIVDDKEVAWQLLNTLDTSIPLDDYRYTIIAVYQTLMEEKGINY